MLTAESLQLIEGVLTRGYISGPVALEMVVTPDGTVDSASVYVVSQEVSADYALRGVFPMLRFTPGTRGGQPARVRTRFSYQKGMLRGVVVAVASGAVGPAAVDTVHHLGSIQVRPELINLEEVQRLVQRNYPPLLRDAGIVGAVRAMLVVGKDGHPEVESIEIMDSSHEAFGDAARRIVERMRFRPGTADGRPVRVRMEVPVSFQRTTKVGLPR